MEHCCGVHSNEERCLVAHCYEDCSSEAPTTEATSEAKKIDGTKTEELTNEELTNEELRSAVHCFVAKTSEEHYLVEKKYEVLRTVG
jgi:hypothetical protein